MTRVRRQTGVALLALVACVAAREAAAQEPAAIAAPAAAPDAAWQWQVDGQAFAGYNYQYRKFFDFDAWESQNWVMATAARTHGTTRVGFEGMLSFEPLTMAAIGSPQVFQTGETFKRAPLIDYQHPHDLLMGLGTDVARTVGATTWRAGASLVGAAPLGPPAFMHRPSAAENPQSPLSHHYLDSTHVTPGLVTAGVERAGVRAEGGWFHGREPDENRTDVDLGALDSWAARVSWTAGPWAAQVSGAHLTQPEIVTPFDESRLTASIAYTKATGDRSLAWLAAVGQKREYHGHFEAYLVEGTWRLSSRHALYARAESVAKDILDAGFHPVGVQHRHRQSQVGAVTVGYVRDLMRRTGSAIGVGADVTGYAVPTNLVEPYGSPWSFHLFVRLKGAAGSAAPAAHHHH